MDLAFFTIFATCLFIFGKAVHGQVDNQQDPAVAAPTGDATPDPPPCEEAWEYVEFLKKEVKGTIEKTLQDSLFQPAPILENVVAQTMDEVLAVRDTLLARTKALRTGEIKICKDQNIKQAEFLSALRSQVMSVLLILIEKDAPTKPKLKEVAKLLLSVRSKANGEITRMIMLREVTRSVTRESDDPKCDCGILDVVVTGLDEVINPETETDDPTGELLTNKLTGILMTVDSEIGSLYSDILGELNQELRGKLIEEMRNYKEISFLLHQTVSKITDAESDEDRTRLIRRDVRSVYIYSRELLDACQTKCPGECKSCGAAKIDELTEKLKDYKSALLDLEEFDALKSVRTDLIQYLSDLNEDTTQLLTEKAENGKLEVCESEHLTVNQRIKGPLWMIVNVTIFGSADTTANMLFALDQALLQMRAIYCVPDAVPQIEPELEVDTCDVEELETAQDYIVDIDSILSESLFKKDGGNAARQKAMLGIIELKSTMDGRIRELFKNNYKCSDELHQIKTFYLHRLSDCLSQMMNPRYDFDASSRVERVQCLKNLRIILEDRRGVLLLREVESNITR